MLAHVLGQPRAWLLTHPQTRLNQIQASAIEAIITRIENGEPLPYVIGRWEFFGLDFILTHQVLIPRPETELLVDTALAWLRSHPDRRWMADVGTGSGCIAVSLAANVSDLKVLATDISRSALKVAIQNIDRHSVTSQVRCIQADLLLPQGTRFDLICANLPYIPTAPLKKLVVYQKEPTLALDGGPTGLSVISRVIDSAPGWLAPGGLLLLEVESSRGVAAYLLSRERFPEADIQILPDLAGNDRLIAIQHPG